MPEFRRYLPPQPPVGPHSEDLYLLASQAPTGGSQWIGGIVFSKGLAAGGKPISADMLLKVRNTGGLYSWWVWEQGIQVEWPGHGPPLAFVVETPPAAPIVPKKRRPKKADKE